MQIVEEETCHNPSPENEVSHFNIKNVLVVPVIRKGSSSTMETTIRDILMVQYN